MASRSTKFQLAAARLFSAGAVAQVESAFHTADPKISRSAAKTTSRQRDRSANSRSARGSGGRRGFAARFSPRRRCTTAWRPRRNTPAAARIIWRPPISPPSTTSHALYSSGINGTGETHRASWAAPTFELSDIESFRSTVRLPAEQSQVIVLNGPDPGIVSTDEEAEADLDVEWSGAVAPAGDGEVRGLGFHEHDRRRRSFRAIHRQQQSRLGDEHQLRKLRSRRWDAAERRVLQQSVATGRRARASPHSSPPATAARPDAIRGVGTDRHLWTGRERTVLFALQRVRRRNRVQRSTATTISTGRRLTTRPVGSALSYIPGSRLERKRHGRAADRDCGRPAAARARIIRSRPGRAGPGVPADGKRDVPDVALSAAGHDGYLVVDSGRVTTSLAELRLHRLRWPA